MTTTAHTFGTRAQGSVALQKPSPMPFQRYVPFEPIDLPDRTCRAGNDHCVTRPRLPDVQEPEVGREPRLPDDVEGERRRIEQLGNATQRAASRHRVLLPAELADCEVAG